jgi:hypothetical protein
MPARSDTDPPALYASTRIIIGGWWPSTAIHLTEVETFLHQGTITQTPTETAQQLRHSLKIGSIQRLSVPMPSLLITTTTGIELWYSADGLYLCSIIQPSISQGRDTLESFLQQQWLPALTALMHRDAPLSQSSPRSAPPSTLVQITTSAPLLFEITPSFSPLTSFLEQPEIVIKNTDDCLFIITTPITQEDGWWLCQWWIFTVAFQAEQSQSLTAYRQLWQSLASFETHQALPISKVAGLQAKLLQRQTEADVHIHRLKQLLNYIDRRLATLDTIDAVKELVQPPEVWSAEAKRSQAYLLSSWKTTAERLEHLQASLNAMEGQARNFNLTLLRGIVTLLTTGIFLSWLHNLAWPDVSVTWIGGTIILLTIGLSFHLLINMYYHQRHFRLLDNRSITRAKDKRARE